MQNEWYQSINLGYFKEIRFPTIVNSFHQ